MLGANCTRSAQKALDQKSSTIRPPSIVPVNSINQSKGISPNGRPFWAKHAIITSNPPLPSFWMIVGSCANSCSVRITPREKSRGG